MTENSRSIRARFALLSKAVLPAVLAALLIGAPAMAQGLEADRIKQEVISLIVDYHVSGVREEDLDTDSIETVIESLNDPYTEYMTSDEWQTFVNSLENNYTGIGIRVGANERGFFVLEVFPDTPAEESGMQAGDYIVAVDGKPSDGWTLDELVGRLSGQTGTKVTVTVERDGKTMDLILQRSDIHLPPLTASLIEPGIGYIRLISFSSDADELFYDETERLRQEGMEALVLDLRNNPGGYLDTAGNIAARFMEDGVLIHAKNRNGVLETYRIGSSDPLEIPVVILVNENSASASEVLAGSLQDYGIARLVGQKTYGKGSVQTLFRLSDGSVLKLTVQEYLTPDKRPVNLVGLVPDVTVYGSVPQLITALQLAGDINVKIEMGDEAMKVNGVPVLERFPVIRESGMVYVPSRVLAAVVEGEAVWDAQNRSVIVRAPRGEAKFDAGSEGVLLRDGTAYIALNRFQTRFAPFSWTDGNGIVTLMEDGGK